MGEKLNSTIQNCILGNVWYIFWPWEFSSFGKISKENWRRKPSEEKMIIYLVKQKNSLLIGQSSAYLVILNKSQWNEAQ